MLPYYARRLDAELKRGRRNAEALARTLERDAGGTFASWNTRLSEWRKGKRPLTPKHAAPLADALGMKGERRRSWLHAVERGPDFEPPQHFADALRSLLGDEWAGWMVERLGMVASDAGLEADLVELWRDGDALPPDRESVERLADVLGPANHTEDLWRAALAGHLASLPAPAREAIQAQLERGPGDVERLQALGDERRALLLRVSDRLSLRDLEQLADAVEDVHAVEAGRGGSPSSATRGLASHFVEAFAAAAQGVASVAEDGPQLAGMAVDRVKARLALLAQAHDDAVLYADARARRAVAELEQAFAEAMRAPPDAPRVVELAHRVRALAGEGSPLTAAADLQATRATLEAAPRRRRGCPHAVPTAVPTEEV